MKKNVIKILLALVALAVAVGTGWMIKAYRDCRRHRWDCAVNIKNGMLFASLMYAHDYQGQFPDNMAKLVECQHLSISRAWICPCSGSDIPSVEDIRAGRCDYVYLGSGIHMNVPNPRKTVVIYCKHATGHRNWVNAGMADGHVEGVEAASIAEAAKRMGWILPDQEGKNGE